MLISETKIKPQEELKQSGESSDYEYDRNNILNHPMAINYDGSKVNVPESMGLDIK